MSKDCIGSNDRMVMYNESERIWKETSINHFWYFLDVSLIGVRMTTEVSCTVCVPAIRLEALNSQILVRSQLVRYQLKIYVTLIYLWLHFYCFPYILIYLPYEIV
jgi:hypothetical protein